MDSIKPHTDSQPIRQEPIIAARLRPRPQLAVLTAGAMFLAVLPGCSGSSATSKPFILTGEGSDQASWPFWASSMRIHPLSRITPDPKNSEQVLVETRIEFTDPWNDACKALGVLTLDLMDGADPNRYDIDLDRYEADLRDLATNVERWDPVTRTYVLKLQVSRWRIPAQPQLAVTFTSADGGRAEDRADVRPYQPQ